MQRGPSASGSSSPESIFTGVRFVLFGFDSVSEAQFPIVQPNELPPYATADERIVDIQGEPLKVLRALESVVEHLRKFLVDHSVLPLFEKSVSLHTPPSPHRRRRSHPGVSTHLLLAVPPLISLQCCGRFLSGSSTPEDLLPGTQITMKVRVVCRKLYDYVRIDLKEIAFPSSLPDPPHLKKRRKLTWKENWYVFKEASRLYAASWVRDIGPDLRPNDYKKDTDDYERSLEDDKKEPSIVEDLAVAARGGMETLKPALQRVYMMRASAYRDALKSFIVGYQEGIQQVVEEKGSSKAQEEEDGGSSKAQEHEEGKSKSM